MTRGATIATISVLIWSAAADASDVVAKRGYADSRFGQIHFHSFAPATGPGPKTPIAFFHQNPRSAVDMEPLTSELGKDRLVLAFDTPGYGLSDRPPAPPDMASLAGAMADALGALGYGQSGKGDKSGRGVRRQIDVFGFHTGSMIASELAVERPDMVRRVVLSGIPYYDVEYLKQRVAMMPQARKTPEDASLVVEQWYSVVNRRTPAMSLDRAADIFLDVIRTLDKPWYATFAVLSYRPAERLPKITQPILIVQPHEMLLEQTRAAHRELMPRATMVEIPGVVEDVFDAAADRFAAAMRPWLDAK